MLKFPKDKLKEIIIKDLFKTIDENNQLKKENSDLKNMLEHIKYHPDGIHFNEILKEFYSLGEKNYL